MNIIDKLLGKKAIIGIQQAPGQLPVKIIKKTEIQLDTASESQTSIGRENKAIIDAITNVKKVAVLLAYHGFRVIDICIGNRNPVIIINPSKRCAVLNGTLIRRARLKNCLVLTYAASIHGVQVEWMVPDHG